MRQSYIREQGDNLATFFRARMICFSHLHNLHMLFTRTMTNCTIIERVSQGYQDHIGARVMIRLTLNWGNFDAGLISEANWSTQPSEMATSFSDVCVCDEY
jgi:hypothetical protein